ncbi:MAG: B-box zinc finger protein [Myxococcota bacterium]
MSSPLAACENHAERPAIGICVACRKRICSECSTKVDGINYCAECLATMAEDRPSAVETSEPGTRGAVYAFGYLLLLTAMAWALVEVAMPGMVLLPMAASGA